MIHIGSNLRLSSLIFILTLLCAYQLLALDPAKSIDQYAVEQWTTANGLPSSTVVAVTQTPEGYLWVAARQHLRHFDGRKFKIHRLFDASQAGYQEITALEIDKDGALWIGTRGQGLFKFKDEVFQIFTKKEEEEKEDQEEKGLSSNFISCLYCDIKNTLWIGTDDGFLNCLKGDKFTRYGKESGLPEPYIYTVSGDSKGNLWVGTRGSGLYRFTNETFVKARLRDFNHYDVTAIREDSSGKLWIGTNRGLVCWEGEKIDLFDKTRGLVGHVIYKIIEDSDGNLWVGTGNGLFRIRVGRTGKLLEGSVVRTIFEDREKSIWVGTDGRGLFRLRDGKISTFSVESGLPHEYVVFMHEDRYKNLRAATMAGLTRFDNGLLSRETMTVEFSDAVVGPICEDHNGNIWFGTYGSGLYKLEKGRLLNYTIRDGLLSDSIISLYNDTRGTLWIGTNRGLGALENGIFKSYRDNGPRLDDVPLLNNEIYCIYEDSKNNLWIGTNKGLTVKKNGRYLTPGGNKLRQLVPSPMVSFIYEDKEKNNNSIFWIATKGNGLIRLKGENQVNVFTTQEGLYSNTIYQVFEDDSGYFWMSCDKGIFKVVKKKLDDLAKAAEDSSPLEKVEYIHYGKSDGMKALECSRWGQYSSIKTSDGKLFFGTPKGISIIDPQDIKINKIPPSVIIERVVINNRALDLDKERDRFIFRTFDYLQFYFTASTLLSPNRVTFRYKLENHDKNWREVKPSQIKMAHYPNLVPGEYTFRVIAANSDGIWDEKGVSFTFTFSPGFIRSPAFKIILGLSMLLAAGLTFRGLKKYRLYRKEKNKYKDSALDPETVDNCMKKLSYVMDVEKVYKDDKLSLQGLSKKVSVTPHILSQVVNEQMKKNFSDFVNSYRVEEAKKLLLEANEDISILHICYEVGFNSKSAFYRAFKKFTNITPSQFQKGEEAKKLRS